MGPSLTLDFDRIAMRNVARGRHLLEVYSQGECDDRFASVTDSRLSDARIPTIHTHSQSDITNPTKILLMSSFHQCGTSRFERYYIAGVSNSITLVAQTPSINVLYCLPFVSTRGGIIDRLAFNVTTAGAAGSKARVGIYDSVSDIDVYPNQLLLDGGDYSATVTGVKATVVNLSLIANKLYFFVFICGTAAPTIRTINGSSGLPFWGLDSAFGGSWASLLSAGQSYGVLPAFFPSGGSLSSGLLPAIGVRFVS